MGILALLIILAVLVLAHETGHFLAAKFFRMDVPEFGLGFPPRLWSKKKGGTEYSINAIPFGGFVRIYGEDDTCEANKPLRKFTDFSAWKQIVVLVAGVTFNLFAAWALFSVSFMSGAYVPITDTSNPADFSRVVTIVTGVLENSPAEKVGIKAGDEVVEVANFSGERIKYPSAKEVSGFIASTGATIMTLVRDGATSTVSVLPVAGLVPEKKVVGVAMETAGVASMPALRAISYAFGATFDTAQAIFVGLVGFVKDAFSGAQVMDEMSGPVGIAGAAGDAFQFGFAYVLGFVAIISINLAVFNILPFPALDGGRVLVVLLEVVLRRKLSGKFVSLVNSLGMYFLIALMLVVTWHDIVKLATS